jgi:hypothetical protein
MAAEGARGSLPRIEELTVTIDLSKAAAKGVRSGMGGKRQGNKLVVKAFDFVPRADLAVELFDTGQMNPVAYKAPHRFDPQDVPRDSDDDFAKQVAKEEADYLAIPLRADSAPVESPPGLDLALVIDTSAATEPGALAIARSMASSLLAHLGPDDRAALWAGDAALRPVAEGSGALVALDASPHASNTIVVLWSDHGWQLGEKEHWRKFALWENLARVVLMFRVPAGTPGLPDGTSPGARSDRTVSLLDLYPTLVDLAGLAEPPDLDGRSIVPLLADGSAVWDRPVVTTYQYGEYSVRDERWRYIRYIDGSEELYDHANDADEWHNLAMDPAFHEVKTRLAAAIPERPAPFVETSYELMSHHIPPLRSLEDYLARKAAGGRR